MRRSRREVIAFHIGVSSSHDIATSLVEDLENRCKQLNIKSTTETVIANAQGVTYILPQRTGVGPYVKRFEKAVSLLSISTYFLELLMKPESFKADYAANWTWNEMFKTASRWVLFGENVHYRSVSNQVLWSVFSESQNLRSLVKELQTIDGYSFSDISVPGGT